MIDPLITVLSGGEGVEREISLLTGREVSNVLSKTHSVRLVELSEDIVPENIDPEETIVFIAMHGPFGEDGELQKILDERGIAYTGSGSKSSFIAMDKPLSKKLAKEKGVPVSVDYTFDAFSIPSPDVIIDALGECLVIKPTNLGSTIGLGVTRSAKELSDFLATIKTGHWMIEPFLSGRELTVGILGDQALGVVEIIPKDGIYDYANKYTKGATEYVYPAKIDKAVERLVQETSLKAFNACGCRDFARADYILSDTGDLFFLEINTIPGMTPTSLLPKSAMCMGISLEELCLKMLNPAFRRYYERSGVRV